MSFHHDGGRYSAHRHQTSILPATGINSRPPAIISIDDATKITKVCAWHHPQPHAKNWADAWSTANGYTPSHGICPACKAREEARHVPSH